MKTILTILCAFLLKAEADAQTWRKISPENANILHTFLTVQDSTQKIHVFGLENETFFHYNNGKWDSISTSIYGSCCDLCGTRY